MSAHRWVVPKQMQSQILRNIHEQGHLSEKKTIEIANRDYYMEGIGKATKKIIANCVPCILVSRKHGSQEGYLHPIEKLDIPLHTIHMDHLGPMPSTMKNYQYLLVVVDAFTKFVWLHPVKNTSVAEVIKRLEI